MIIPLDSEINFAYSPGCGGFYFLHQLLLCDQHWTKFQLPEHIEQSLVAQLSSSERSKLVPSRPKFFEAYTAGCPSYPDHVATWDTLAPQYKQILEPLAQQYPGNLEDIPGLWPRILAAVIDYHWNVDVEQGWKTTEIWPDNDYPMPHKEYLHYKYLPGRYHRVYFNCKNESPLKDDIFQPYPGKKIFLYTDIKSQDALSIFKRTLRYWRYTSGVINNAEPWQDCLVNEGILPGLKAADITIRLQDFVLDQEQFLGPMNSAQQALRQRWLDLHPPELLKSIGL